MRKKINKLSTLNILTIEQYEKIKNIIDSLKKDTKDENYTIIEDKELLISKLSEAYKLFYENIDINWYEIYANDKIQDSDFFKEKYVVASIREYKLDEFDGTLKRLSSMFSEVVNSFQNVTLKEKFGTAIKNIILKQGIVAPDSSFKQKKVVFALNVINDIEEKENKLLYEVTDKEILMDIKDIEFPKKIQELIYCFSEYASRMKNRHDNTRYINRFKSLFTHEANRRFSKINFDSELENLLNNSEKTVTEHRAKVAVILTFLGVNPAELTGLERKHLDDKGVRLVNTEMPRYIPIPMRARWVIDKFIIRTPKAKYILPVLSGEVYKVKSQEKSNNSRLYDSLRKSGYKNMNSYWRLGYGLYLKKITSHVAAKKEELGQVMRYPDIEMEMWEAAKRYGRIKDDDFMTDKDKDIDIEVAKWDYFKKIRQYIVKK